MKITLVTGNPNKLKELEAIAPDYLQFDSHAIDLPEIQSLDPREVVTDKVQRAYEAVQEPVIVEDVSIGFDDFADLPGPFYKFFREKIGDEVLLKLAKIGGDRTTIRCDAAYFDGHEMKFGEGIIHGTIVNKRGGNGFGFDPYVVPDGQIKTMAEMSAEEKHAISHRGRAFRNLLEQLAPDQD